MSVEGSVADLGRSRAEEVDLAFVEVAASLVDEVEEIIFDVILSRSRCLSLGRNPHNVS